MSSFLDKVVETGFSGVLNCPTIALIDGSFRVALEETGITYDKEVEMIRLAHEKNLFTMAFATNKEEARKMVNQGKCDMIVAHVGNTTGGSIGARTTLTLEEATRRVQEVLEATKEANPEDFRYVAERVRGLVGFFTGSSVERIPAEPAIKNVTAEFKKVPINV